MYLQANDLYDSAYQPLAEFIALLPVEHNHIAVELHVILETLERLGGEEAMLRALPGVPAPDISRIQQAIAKWIAEGRRPYDMVSERLEESAPLTTLGIGVVIDGSAQGDTQ
jgi:hypothetical protein